jgi:hypothetical protein
MTTLKRRILFTSLAAAGLLSSGMASAAELDVSTIYGRGAPPNAHITESTAPVVTQAARNTTQPESTASGYESAAMSEAEVPQAYPEHASRTLSQASTPGQDIYAEDATGRIHEEPLDGLVDGRGMGQDVNRYAAAPVRAEPLFDVADILGRASPPAPWNAPDFGQPS